jgi:hypothetical protein
VCFNRKSRLNSGASCIFLFPFQVVYLVSLTLGFLLKLRGIKLRSLDEKRDMHVFKKTSSTSGLSESVESYRVRSREKDEAPVRCSFCNCMHLIELWLWLKQLQLHCASGADSVVNLKSF